MGQMKVLIFVLLNLRKPYDEIGNEDFYIFLLLEKYVVELMNKASADLLQI